MKTEDPPFAQDIRTLIRSYVALNTFGLKEFKELWKSLKFSRIHEGKTDDANPQEYLQELFSTCLGYLIVPNLFTSRVASIYSLYYLYQTQSLHPRVKVNVSIEIFEQIIHMREQTTRTDLSDLYNVLNRMREQGTFSHVSYVKIDPLLSNLNPPPQDVQQAEPPPFLSSSFLNPANRMKNSINLQRIKQAASAYTLFKNSMLDPAISKDSESKFVDELVQIVNSQEKTKEHRVLKFREEWRKKIQRENIRLNRQLAKAGNKAEQTVEQQQQQQDEDGGGWVEQVIKTITTKVGANTAEQEKVDHEKTNSPPPSPLLLPPAPVIEEEDRSMMEPSPIMTLAKRKQQRDFIDDFLLDKSVPTQEEILQEPGDVNDEQEQVNIDVQGNVIIPDTSNKKRKIQPLEDDHSVGIVLSGKVSEKAKRVKWLPNEIAQLKVGMAEFGHENVQKIYETYFANNDRRTINSVKAKIAFLKKNK